MPHNTSQQWTSTDGANLLCSHLALLSDVDQTANQNQSSLVQRDCPQLTDRYAKNIRSAE